VSVTTIGIRSPFYPEPLPQIAVQTIQGFFSENPDTLEKVVLVAFDLETKKLYLNSLEPET